MRAGLRHHAGVDARLAGQLAGEGLDRALDVLEREVVRVHLLERDAARLDEPDGGLVGTAGDGERAPDGDLLDDDQVAHEVGHGLQPLHAGQYDAPARGHVVERLGHRLGRVGGDLDHRLRPAPAGQLAHARAGVLPLDVDHVIGAELARERELPRVAREAGHDDRVGARGARGDHAREAALPGAEHEHAVARAGGGDLDRPAEARAERVEHDREARRDVLAHPVHDRERIEVHVVRVRAPQAGRAVEGDVAVPEEPAAPAAELVAARDAGPAVAAANDRLDRDAIADVDAPALRRPVADALDHAERLVPGHQGQADGKDAGVLLGVAPADAARLDAQKRAVVVDVGDGQLAQLEAARRGLHDGPARPHGASKHGAARRVQALAPEPVLDDDGRRACSATAAGHPSTASACPSAASARAAPPSSTAAGTATSMRPALPTTAASLRPRASRTRSRGISATGSAPPPPGRPPTRARAAPAPPWTHSSRGSATNTSASRVGDGCRNAPALPAALSYWRSPWP